MKEKTTQKKMSKTETCFPNFKNVSDCKSNEITKSLIFPDI